MALSDAQEHDPFSEFAGGDDHDPIWTAQLVYLGQTFEGTSNTKTAAKKLAAISAYNCFQKTIITQTKNSNFDRKQKVNNIMDIDLNQYDKIILIDGENYNINLPEFTNFNSNIILFIFFAAKNTTKNIIFELQKNYSNCYVFLSHVVGPDAADHLLTFYAGKLSMLYNGGIPDNQIIFYILTKDHFGQYIQVFLPNSRFICSLEEIF